MSKPRIFLGPSGEQAKLLRAIARRLSDVADVEPWTTSRSRVDRPDRTVTRRPALARASSASIAA